MAKMIKSELSDWSGFGFKYVEKPDYSKVLTHFKNNYYEDEPFNHVIGLTPERIADMDERYTNVLDLNHGSFYAYPLDQPDKVAGVMLFYIHEKGKDLPHATRSPLTRMYARAINELWKRYDIFKEKCADAYPDLFIVSTDREYRGKGLATEMYRKAIANCRASGYKFAASEFSSPISRRMGEKLGFKQVARLDLDECKNEDGSLLFGEAGNGHYAITTVLDLN